MAVSYTLFGRRDELVCKQILLAERGHGPNGDGAGTAGRWKHGVCNAVLGVQRAWQSNVYTFAAALPAAMQSPTPQHDAEWKQCDVHLEYGKLRDAVDAEYRVDTGRERYLLAEPGDENVGEGERIADERRDGLRNADVDDRRAAVQQLFPS